MPKNVLLMNESADSGKVMTNGEELGLLPATNDSNYHTSKTTLFQPWWRL